MAKTKEDERRGLARRGGHGRRGADKILDQLLNHNAARVATGMTTIEAVVSEELIALALFRKYPDAIVVTNEQGIIVLANNQAEILLRYDRSDLIGMNVDMLVPEARRQDHAKLRDGYYACPYTRSTGVGLLLRARRKDGSSVPIEVNLLPEMTPMGFLVIAVLRQIDRSDTDGGD